RSVAGGAVAAIGLAVLLAGAIGMLRFPDFYTRLHAMNASHIAGAPIVLVGLAIMSPNGGLALRLLLLAGLIVALAPVLTHVLANTGDGAGLSASPGKYGAARAGARTA